MVSRNPSIVDFQAQLAEFISYVGGTELQKSTSKVIQKLALIYPEIRSRFGTRYFFHEQFDNFINGPAPFQLNLSSARAIRAASFVVASNLAADSMSNVGRARFRRMIIDNLAPDRDIRQLEHELRAFIDMRLRFDDVKFADCEGLGNFDLMCRSGALSVEVECKTISEDTGNPIKNELLINFSQEFLRRFRKRIPTNGPGIVRVQFDGEPASSMLQEFRGAIASSLDDTVIRKGGAISFLPRPSWRRGTGLSLEQLRDDPDIAPSHCVTIIDGQGFGLSLVCKNKQSALADRATRVLKEAASKQLSGKNPSIIWLHFVGFAELEFRQLAQFSMGSGGGGLNLLVANALSPGASPTDRSHVNAVRFSGEPEEPSRNRVIEGSEVVEDSSLGGVTYDVPNPYALYPWDSDPLKN